MSFLPPSFRPHLVYQGMFDAQHGFVCGCALPMCTRSAGGGVSVKVFSVCALGVRAGQAIFETA